MLITNVKGAPDDDVQVQLYLTAHLLFKYISEALHYILLSSSKHSFFPVSLGGTAGLFLGASLISAVELLVHIFVRIWTTHPQTNHSIATDDIPRQRKIGVKNQVTIVQYTDSEFGKKLPYYGKDYGLATVFI